MNQSLVDGEIAFFILGFYLFGEVRFGELVYYDLIKENLIDMTEIAILYNRPTYYFDGLF
jgi:hypothetical protein